MKQTKYIWLLIMVSISLIMTFQGCIKNDIPFPKIPQLILDIKAEGESKAAYIDSISFEVNIYLDEKTDIENVRFSEYQISPEATSNPDLREGSYNLSYPLFVTLSRFQDYTWEIKAHQDIVRYFDVVGQVGESVIDPIAMRVIVQMPEGTDLSKLTLERVKLGPEGITTMDPELKPGSIDLSYPLRVNVTAHDRTQIWTIYAEFTEAIVTTTHVDPWSKIIWAYGAGPADVQNGFEFKKTSDSKWIPVPGEYITQNQGSFSCYIPHLEPLTEYAVRSVSGSNKGNEIIVRTQATADIPDGSFDQWSLGGDKGNMWCPWNKDGVRFWDTGNGGSITLGQNLTTPTDHTATGQGQAARCETRFVALFGIGKLGSGSIFTGTYIRTDGTNGVLGFGRPWNLRPTKLKGFYQYTSAEINYASEEFKSMKGQQDICHIYVAITDWTAPFEIRTNPKNRQLFDKDSPSVIGYGELEFSGKMDAYQPFEIEIIYRDTSRIPSYLQITCSASKYGDYFTGGAGSLLYVDEFSFDYDY